MENLEVVVGTDHYYLVTYVDSNSDPVPLVSLSNAVWVVSDNSDVVKITKTLTTSGIVVSDEGAGQMLITILSADTLPPVGSATADVVLKHELRLYFGDGTSEVPLDFSGTFTILKSVTLGVT